MEAPILVGELELTEPINDISLPAREDGLAYNSVRLLVRMQHMTVGYVSLLPDALDAAAISRKVWLEHAAAINKLRSRAGLAALDTLPAGGIAVEEGLVGDTADRPMVTVVLCTRDRPVSVVETLRGLVAMHYRQFEIVLVDNAPSSDATKEAVLKEFGTDPRIRYVREPRPGLSCARNRGIAEALTDIVAFTDDDVRVDPWWLDGIMRGFGAAPDVACVTGLVPTAEIENAAQLYFDLRAGWGNVCERRIFDLTENRDDSPLYPYATGVYGAGANFAMFRKLLNELGGFDEALGAGTPCGGGEDIDMFVRVILSGNRIVYEPSAIVSHHHRSELSALEKQLSAYGSGTTAAIAAILMRHARARREVPAKVAGGVMHVLKLRDRTNDNPSLPAGLMLRELRGMTFGPWLYLKGRYKLRRLAGLSRLRGQP
jgi:glycosyltransferase involved in cell wall biosynthesis